MAASVLGVAFFCALLRSFFLGGTFPCSTQKNTTDGKKRAFLFDFVLFSTATYLQMLVFCCFFALCCCFGCWVVLFTASVCFSRSCALFCVFPCSVVIFCSSGLNSGRYDWEYLKFFPSSLIFKKSTDREKRVREI